MFLILDNCLGHLGNRIYMYSNNFLSVVLCNLKSTYEFVDKSNDPSVLICPRFLFFLKGVLPDSQLFHLLEFLFHH